MKKTILILSLAGGLFFLSCNSDETAVKQSEVSAQDLLTKNFKSPKENLSVDEVFALSKQNVLIIDVREPDELIELSYDVKNIINIPLAEIESHLAEIPKDKQVIVVCKKGGRSLKAYELLKEKGFENVSNMEGGMDAWNGKGLPTITPGEKKTCCADPKSKDCNPDGTCKSPTDKKK